jgi:sugar/nucleoside kinase (ribokinase family)
MPKVVTLGILVADALARPVEEWPARGKLVFVDQITLQMGGCASNTGVALQKLGVPTAVVGKVGQDGFGDFVIHELESAGVDTRGVARDTEFNTSATLVSVADDGERTFIHYRGANGALRPEEFDYDFIAEADFLHVAGVFLMPGFDGEPAARALAEAKRRGVKTCCDTAWDASGRWDELMAPMLPYIDYFLPSLEEAREITGLVAPADVAASLLDRGVSVVALKMGADGCGVWTRDGHWTAPRFTISAVDATGAGDAFCAGFICGLTRGWDYERCATLGNATGALCVTGMGAVTALRDFAGTVGFVEEQTGRRFPID